MSLSRLTPEIEALKLKLDKFVKERCQPAEREYDFHMKDRVGRDRWVIEAIPPCIERLKEEAKALGLWNLFIPPHLYAHVPCCAPSVLLSYREYGILCESMGKSFLAPEVCNCNAPDTGIYCYIHLLPSEENKSNESLSRNREYGGHASLWH